MGGIAAVSALRLYECALYPAETGDLLRNLLYGVAVRDYGLAAAGLPLADISPAWAGVSWSNLPYNYPPAALAFFVGIASISPSMFAAKLALTALEAGNAWLIHRLCGSRWLGLVYWASPASIWWTSREGQFEAMQTTFTLLSLLALTRFPLLCGVGLALAIATKMTAAALLPWVAYEVWKSGSRALALAALGLVLGSLPALGVELHHGGVSNVFRFSSPLIYNPYYWDFTANMFSWNPIWLIVANQIASYGMLCALIALAVRSRDPLAFLAPIALVVFCKLHTNVQFWYFVYLPALLVPIPEPKSRFVLIAVCPLLDLRSTLQLLVRPLSRRAYRSARSVFDLYRPPLR